MLNNKGELKSEFRYLQNGQLHKPLENLVIRGFAEYFNQSQHGHNKIVINKEGLLVGEVLSDIETGNPFIKVNYYLYSRIIDHIGAFLLLIITIWGLWNLFEVERILNWVLHYLQ